MHLYAVLSFLIQRSNNHSRCSNRAAGMWLAPEAVSVVYLAF